MERKVKPFLAEFEDTKRADRNRKVERQTRPWPTNKNERQTQNTQTILKTKAGVIRTLYNTRVSSGAPEGLLSRQSRCIVINDVSHNRYRNGFVFTID